MKSKYFAVALSAVALVACNNEDVLEVNQGRGISFQVATEASTRAQATTTSNIDEFMVWGFTQEDPAQTLMEELSVSKSGSDWTYTGTIFWPAAAVDFYSISPEPVNGKVSEGSVSIASSEQKITGFTVNKDQSQQVDLLYAVNKGETKKETAVEINFRHALSQILFKAKNTNENLKVIIKSVKIANIKKVGDFTYPKETTKGPVDVNGNIPTDAEEDEQPTNISNTDTQGSWTVSEQTLEEFTAGVTELTLDGVQDAKDLTTTNEGVYTGALFMIPQKLTAWDPKTEGCEASDDVYFLLNCQILSGTNKDVQVWPEETTSTSADIAVPASAIEWEQGKKYVYTFVFGEGAGYEPGEDPNPDPTLVGIDFTVTVDEFINGFDPNDDEEVDMKTDKE